MNYTDIMKEQCESICKETGGDVIRYDCDGKKELLVSYKVENYPFTVADRRVVKVDMSGKE